METPDKKPIFIGVYETRKIFATYLDQEYEAKPETDYMRVRIKKQDAITCQFLNMFHHHGADLFFSEFWILLKPLGEISDEDAIAVAKLCRLTDIPECDVEIIKQNKATWAEELCQRGERPIPVFPYGILKAIDYLRSRGYAMPYGQYSVEDLVEAGVYKLI